MGDNLLVAGDHPNGQTTLFISSSKIRKKKPQRNCLAQALAIRDGTFPAHGKQHTAVLQRSSRRLACAAGCREHTWQCWEAGMCRRTHGTHVAAVRLNPWHIQPQPQARSSWHHGASHAPNLCSAAPLLAVLSPPCNLLYFPAFTGAFPDQFSWKTRSR